MTQFSVEALIIDHFNLGIYRSGRNFLSCVRKWVLLPVNDFEINLLKVLAYDGFKQNF